MKLGGFVNTLDGYNQSLRGFRGLGNHIYGWYPALGSFGGLGIGLDTFTWAL